MRLCPPRPGVAFLLNLHKRRQRMLAKRCSLRNYRPLRIQGMSSRNASRARRTRAYHARSEAFQARHGNSSPQNSRTACMPARKGVACGHQEACLRAERSHLSRSAAAPRRFAWLAHKRQPMFARRTRGHHAEEAPRGRGGPQSRPQLLAAGFDHNGDGTAPRPDRRDARCR
jgi:hypothetical protein